MTGAAHTRVLHAVSFRPGAGIFCLGLVLTLIQCTYIKTVFDADFRGWMSARNTPVARRVELEKQLLFQLARYCRVKTGPAAAARLAESGLAAPRCVKAQPGQKNQAAWLFEEDNRWKARVVAYYKRKPVRGRRLHRNFSLRSHKDFNQGNHLPGKAGYTSDVFDVQVYAPPGGRLKVESLTLNRVTPLDTETALRINGGLVVVESQIPIAFRVDKKHGPRYFADSTTLSFFTPPGLFYASLTMTHSRAAFLEYRVTNNGGQYIVDSRISATLGRKPLIREVSLNLSEAPTGFYEKSLLYLYRPPPAVKAEGQGSTAAAGTSGTVSAAGSKGASDTRALAGNQATSGRQVVPVEFDHLGREQIRPGKFAPLLADRPLKGEAVWQKKTLSRAGRVITYETAFFRPDPGRPHAVVTFYRFDPAAIRLHLVPGFQEPDRGKNVLPAAFNGIAAWADRKDITSADFKTSRISREKTALWLTGGFKTFHSPSGMVVDGHTIFKPVNNRATLGIYDNGRLAVDDWRYLPKKGLVCLRQNAPYILHNYRYNPFMRYTSYGLGFGLLVFTWRSAVGIDSGGRFVYAVGNSLTHLTLGRALSRAGVKNAMQLEINTHHVKAAWVEYKNRRFQYEMVEQRLQGELPDLEKPAPRDFILVSLK